MCPARNGLRENRECRAAQISAKAMSASKLWTEAMIELPGVREGGMLGRNGPRKLGTTRGSPRRSRTAKASPISRSAVKSRCAREWDGWGRLSGDGPRQQNSNQSEDPLGRRATHPPWRCTIESSARHSAGLPKMTTKCTNGGCKPNMSQCTPGAGLSWLMRWKAPPEMPAFQPYRGKPAVRNDRESRGNDGIIRSPGSRLDSTRLRDEDGQPPHLLGRRNFLHLAAGAAALPAVSRFAWAQALFLAMMLAASSLAAAEIPLTIDQLLAQGWEIAGYASGYDNRTSLILFRHPGVNVLVQCGILYDVTRAQRTVVNCYELR